MDHVQVRYSPVFYVLLSVDDYTSSYLRYHDFALWLPNLQQTVIAQSFDVENITKFGDRARTHQNFPIQHNNIKFAKVFPSKFTSSKQLDQNYSYSYTPLIF